MKTGRILYITALAGLLAWAVSLDWRNHALRQELEQQQQTTAWLRRAAVGTTNLVALGREVQDLERQLATATQSLTRAELQYEEERRTHDPLRAQIEKMNADTLRHTHENTQSQERLRQLQKALAEAEAKQRTTQAENQTLAAEKQDLLNRLKNAETEKQKGLEAQADLRARIATVEQQMASSSNEVTVIRANLEEAFRTISEQQKRIRDLSGSAPH